MSALETAAWAVTAFFAGMAIGTYTTVSKWNALVDSARMNGKRWQLMFLEASEKYWRTRAQVGPEPFCTETADSYKQEADTLRPEVTP
jgi:hypothetical protein